MNELIEVKMPGAVLFLTPDEFTRAVKRGKAILRARRQDERLRRFREERAAVEADRDGIKNEKEQAKCKGL